MVICRPLSGFPAQSTRLTGRLDRNGMGFLCQSERQSTKTPLEFRYFRVEGCIPESGHAFNVTRQIFVLYAQEYQRLWCPSQMI